MKNTWKRYLPDILVVLLFVVVSFAYFFPSDIEGKVLFRHDSSAGVGAGQEASEYYLRTGEYTRWSNSTFSGIIQESERHECCDESLSFVAP